ncbi:CPBP family intramembrane glutamic endopeptidase [Kiritimatiella glycovorans]|uniref:CAAX amino terminal protease self-immunity n=1 Tax=Kiritimatiella glycovorans TaxID=1307763 RepID=A0A0G3EKN9_9BACT|nr:CPBP family intramembrane glutamic endopeptidase [Kiritimatiella glycovorans]AKJ64744.1 CAAX amino terminal protease self- immunity [Kiritimatiella glycovorans]
MAERLQRFISSTAGTLPRIPPAAVCLLGVAVFNTLFVFHGAGLLDVWWGLSAALLLLIMSAMGRRQEYARAMLDDLRQGIFRKVVLGAFAGVLLYGVFAAGRWGVALLWSGGVERIAGVYTWGAGRSPVELMLILGFLIGPGEEIFWRGFVQSYAEKTTGLRTGLFVMTGLYAAAHLATGNGILLIAAAVCGLYWGLLFRTLRSITVNVISHAVFDIMAFVIFPFS